MLARPVISVHFPLRVFSCDIKAFGATVQKNGSYVALHSFSNSSSQMHFYFGEFSYLGVHDKWSYETKTALPPLFLHNRKFRSPSSLTNCCVVKASDFGLNGNVIDLSTAIIYDYWQSCSSEYNTFSTVSKLLERLKPK